MSSRRPIRRTRALARDIVIAAFVYASLSKNTVQDNRVQSNVDVPEDPAPDNQERTEKKVYTIAVVIVFEQARRTPAQKGHAGAIACYKDVFDRFPAKHQLGAGFTLPASRIGIHRYCRQAQQGQRFDRGRSTMRTSFLQWSSGEVAPHWSVDLVMLTPLPISSRRPKQDAFRIIELIH